MPQYRWFDTSAEAADEWSRLCPAGEYRLLSPDELPDVVPNGLLAKADSVLVVASGSSDGYVYYMANVQRVDDATQMIDQEPFGIAFAGSVPTVSGVLVHHGDWEGRTSPPPPEFWTGLSSSALPTLFPLGTVPEGKTSGSIDALNRGTGQQGAFDAVVEKLKQFTTAANDEEP